MTKEAEGFGKVLRRARQDAGKTMGDLARHLRVSVTYISDVERGRRPPLNPERLEQAIAFLGQKEALYAAAVRARGELKIDSTLGDRKVSTLTALARGVATDEQWDEIWRVLSETTTEG
jgi:transcriptional regulator with XRE-family HTH domain